MSMFVKAKKEMAALKLAVQGVSGAGKTFSSLKLAKSLAGDGKIAVLDTENNSAALYSDFIEFDCVNLMAPYTPEKYINVINEAVKADYKVLVIDSISHEWEGDGGILYMVEEKTAASRANNSFTAWKDPKKRHQKFIDAIVSAPIHIICTMRQKAEYEQGRDQNGKPYVRQIGLKSVQDPNINYNFTNVFDLHHETVNGQKPFTLSKDRTCGALDDIVYFDESIGEKLNNWLATCSKPVPIPMFADDTLNEKIHELITPCLTTDELERNYHAIKNEYVFNDEQLKVLNRATNHIKSQILEAVNAPND